MGLGYIQGSVYGVHGVVHGMQAVAPELLTNAGRHTEPTSCFPGIIHVHGPAQVVYVLQAIRSCTSC
jgi:hypothetical protein